MNNIIDAFNRGYAVSLEGQAYNKYGEKVGRVSNKGYIEIAIRVKGKVTNIAVHRLQAFQKYGYKLFEQGILVRHFNGNSTDNSWENILIGTQSDNMMDIPEQLRISRALHATSFVRKYDKEEVKKFHAIDKSYKETMKKFNISSKGTLNYILNN